MNKLLTFIILIVAVLSESTAQNGGITNTNSSPYAQLRSVSLGDVKWTEGFWYNKFKDCQEKMLPYWWNLLNDAENGGAVENLKIAAGLSNREYKGTNWHDGDLCKWIEAAAYVYAVNKDEKLKSQMDQLIDLIGKAMEPDGYFSTLVTTNPEKQRYNQIRDHELYNAGHLITAACIHYRATGETKFLVLAKKNADHLMTVFMEPENELLYHFPTNPSVYMALVELYRTTGKNAYLKLAERFVSYRGAKGKMECEGRNCWFIGSDVQQDRRPIRKETEAVGHVVRANYLYAGVTDLYLETGEDTLISVMKTIWEDVVNHKMHVTGGCGPMRFGLTSRRDIANETYSHPYVLPNTKAYNETCANISNAMWNWRMFQHNGDAKYMDIVELVMYNSGISGVSIDGQKYWYTNPLRRINNFQYPFGDELADRKENDKSYCCGTSQIRTIAKAQNFAYSLSDKALWVNMYGSNKLNTRMLDGSKLSLIQSTNYPWEGSISLEMTSVPRSEFSVMLRIPSWAEEASVSVNGKEIDTEAKSGQYAEVRRKWKKRDKVEIELPMQPTLIQAHPLVEENRNQVAVKNGPIVYCLESKDLPEGTSITEVVLPSDTDLKAQYKPDFLGGIGTINGTALIRKQGSWEGQLYKPVKPASYQSIELKLIPYFIWNNRGESEMSVWLPVDWR